MQNNTPKTAKRHLKWTLPLIILGCAIAAFVMLKNSKPKAPSKPVVEKVWSVKAIKAQVSNYQPEIILYGKVEAPDEVKLSSPVTAYAQSIAIKEGDTVKAGEPLIQLDTRDSELILQQREADVSAIDAQINALKIQHAANKKALQIEKRLFNLSSKTVSRYQDLKKRKAISEDQFDNAQMSYNQQALSLNNREQAINAYPAQLAQLEAQKSKAVALKDTTLLDVKRSTIKAPFNGRVTAVNIAAGDRVKSGDTLASVYSPESLQIRSQVPNQALPIIRQLLQQAQQLHARSEFDGEALQLNLERLASSAQNGKSGVDGLLTFGSNTIYPEPGRTLEMTLVLPGQPGLIAIPPSALYGTDRIYTVQDNKLKAVTITRSGNLYDTQGNNQLLIRTSEIKDGDVIVTTQLPNAISGLPVKVTE